MERSERRRWAGFAPQIHDRAQANAFHESWGSSTEIAFLRFEAGVAGGKAHRFVDLLFYHPHADRVFVLLGGVLGEDGSFLFPDLVRGWDPALLDGIAETVRREAAEKPPDHMEIRQGSRFSSPFELRSVTGERVLPGACDYQTLVHHVRRYRFFRDRMIPGRVLDCACGTGYGASMLLQRRDLTGYVGVDLSDFAVGFARKLVKESRAEFVRRPLSEVDDGGFENVVSFETIEHTPDPHAFLADLAAKLDPAGQLILSFPAERWHGAHSNRYHVTNWNYFRIERMASAFFRDVMIHPQRLSLLDSDTFGRSPILDRECNEEEDEFYIVVLRGPKHGTRRRTVIRCPQGIGKTIWSTPVVAAVRARHPDRDVVVMTDVTQIFLRNPDADIVATNAFLPRGTDTVIDLAGGCDSDRHAHLLETYRRAAGIPFLDLRTSLYPDKADLRLVAETLHKLRWYAAEVKWIVAVHMASGPEDRIWPARHWKRFLEDLLSDPGVGVIFAGDPGDIDPDAFGLPHGLLSRGAKVPTCSNLLLAAAAMEVADLFVGPDSEMSQVAAAVGTPGVVLYSMADTRTRLPLGGGSVGLWAGDGRPPGSPPGTSYGMEKIEPAAVLGAVRGILEMLPPFGWERRARLHAPDVGVPTAREFSGSKRPHRKELRLPENPRVSIIIPVYNQLSFTKRCLETLAENTGEEPPWEVVVVDDASTDGTASYLADLADRIVVVRNPVNGGFSRACNTGARTARGEYLVFLNNDTEPQAGWLPPLLAEVEAGRAEICGARLLYPDGTIQHAGVAFNEKSRPYHIFRRFPANDPAVVRKRAMRCVTASCMLVRKEMFLALGGFDEGFRNGFEDVDFCLRAGAAGKRILYVPESVLVHYEETSPGRRRRDTENEERLQRLWRGKIRCDDREIYAKEGWAIFVNPDGTARLERVVPVGREDAGSGRAPAPAG
ncbi:MAG: hypothetical protein Kow00128_00770 [Deltaproteobacteria bacterium]